MNPLLFVILLIMVIFTLYHFRIDTLNMLNGTAIESFSNPFRPKVREGWGIIGAAVSATANAVGSLFGPPPCSASPCKGNWSNYGKCELSGGKYKRTRYYNVTQTSDCGGKACPHNSGDTSTTESGCEGTNCEGAWGDWSDECYEMDGEFKKERTYFISKQKTLNGSACPHASGHVEYTTEGCDPVPAVGEWRGCGKGQGVGKCQQRYLVTEPGKYGGVSEFPDGDIRICDASANNWTGGNEFTDALEDSNNPQHRCVKDIREKAKAQWTQDLRAAGDGDLWPDYISNLDITQTLTGTPDQMAAQANDLINSAQADKQADDDADEAARIAAEEAAAAAAALKAQQEAEEAARKAAEEEAARKAAEEEAARKAAEEEAARKAQQELQKAKDDAKQELRGWANEQFSNRTGSPWVEGFQGGSTVALGYVNDNTHKIDSATSESIVDNRVDDIKAGALAEIENAKIEKAQNDLNDAKNEAVESIPTHLDPYHYPYIYLIQNATSINDIPNKKSEVIQKATEQKEQAELSKAKQDAKVEIQNNILTSEGYIPFSEFAKFDASTVNNISKVNQVKQEIIQAGTVKKQEADDERERQRQEAEAARLEAERIQQEAEAERLRLQQEAQAAADEAERQRLEAEAAAAQAAAVAAELEAAKKTAIEELGEDQYVMKFESIHCCYAAKINAVQNVAEIADVKNKILDDAQKLEDAEIAMREAEKTAEELRQKATEAEAARIKAIQENASEAAQKAAAEAARVAKEQALQAEKMKRDAEAQAKKDAEKMISQTVRFKDGNTRATTSTSKTYVDKSGASVEKKCISISDLHGANKWVDHLFNTLGQTKCANPDQVNSARSAAKLDFISGSIARSNQQFDESNQHYIKGINTAKPYLDKAFSGEGVNGSNNNNAQGSNQSMSNNLYQTQSGVTNNIRPPNNPVWQDQQLASQFGGNVLPNGFVVQKGNGECPNGCKFPQYDNKSCEDVIYNGKQYRKCPWVKDGLNGNDCMKCGAILMPKNHHGYARTAPGLFNNVSMEMASKSAQNMSAQKNSDFYNIGKQFMNQLSKIKNFNLPNTINTNEFVSIGKLVHKYQTEKTHQTGQLLSDFVSGILATTSISHRNKIQQNANIPTNISRTGGVFHMDVEKLTGKGVNAYVDAENELASNNRLGGSSSLYKKHLNDQTRQINGIPRDPRKRPSPYNSIWNVFNY